MPDVCCPVPTVVTTKNERYRRVPTKSCYRLVHDARRATSQVFHSKCLRAVDVKDHWRGESSRHIPVDGNESKDLLTEGGQRGYEAVSGSP